MDEAALRRSLDRAVTAVGGPRRVAVALLVGVAVLAALRALSPGGPATVAVWAAAHDLPGGQPLRPSDLRLVDLPAAAVPGGALRAGATLVGRLVAAPMRRGEPVTDVRLLDPALLDALPTPGLVAVPVRVGDGSAAAALVHAGDVVDVIATGDATTGALAPTRTVASAVRVLTVPARSSGSADGGGLVVVAGTAKQAAALAAAAGSARLSLALEHP